MKNRISAFMLIAAALIACGGANFNPISKPSNGFAASSTGAILYGYGTTQNPSPLRLLGPLGVPMPSSGTLQNLYGRAEPVGGIAGATVTVKIEGVDSVLSCDFDSQGRCVNSSVQVSVTTGQLVQAWISYPSQPSPEPVVALTLEKK